jgi:5-formyltetrahydrofolate cyclo-ligase
MHLSTIICESLFALPEYISAQTVCFYVDSRSEVRTRDAIAKALKGDKRVVVPWCNQFGELELFHLSCDSDLKPGMYGILEPMTELRADSTRRVLAAELDLIVVPGVAFDLSGARIGSGRGYFDKFLALVRPTAVLIGLAFECQLFPALPVADHDVALDLIVTERSVHRCVGRRRPT